jgi:CTP:molybdopterin cytidylyltransferase MocA
MDVVETRDGFPAAEGVDTAHLLVPHEYFPIVPRERWPTAEQRGRTVGLCVEHPGTDWFEVSLACAATLGGIVDINRSSVSEQRRRGLDVEHFQLGYLPEWDAWHGCPAQSRPIDVLYMGSEDPRRARILAGYAAQLWHRRCQLLLPPVQDRTAPRADHLLGAAKHRRMASSKLLVNLHRGRTRAFEWVRALEAICNGCAVVTERSTDLAPLVPGIHLVAGEAGSLALLANHLLDCPDRLDTMRRTAHEFVQTEMPMGPSVDRLLELAERLVRRPRRHRPDPPVKPEPERASWSPEAPATPVWDEAGLMRSALKHLVVEVGRLHRRVEELQAERAEPILGGGRTVLVEETPAYGSGVPRVSVVISLYNYELEVGDALASVAASEFEDLEVIVVDDASRDGSVQAVQAFMRQHPWLPAKLLRHVVNQGLGATRNDGVAASSGELVFVLDADNELFPTTLRRLVEVLDGDPRASFAYSIIAMHSVTGPCGLLSALPWEPERLRSGNYIDAMALIRRAEIDVTGGYSEDPRLVGWEDYDLWCRFADAGRYGAHLNEIQGRYRVAEHSMSRSWTNIDRRVATSLLRARAPRLHAPVMQRPDGEGGGTPGTRRNESSLRLL